VYSMCRRFIFSDNVARFDIVISEKTSVVAERKDMTRQRIDE